MLPKQGVIYVDPSIKKRKNATKKIVEPPQDNFEEKSEAHDTDSAPTVSNTPQSTEETQQNFQDPHSEETRAQVYAGLQGKMSEVSQKAQLDLADSEIQDSVKEGQKEGVKDRQKEEVKSEEKFDSVHDTSNKVLFECESVFPFQLVPDQLTIDLHKVNIITKTFPFIKNIHSIYIDDISEVEVTSNIIFGSITIKDRFFAHQSNTVSHLKISDAMRSRRIIQGLIVAVREKIDLSKVHETELIAKLDDLGKAVGQAQIPVSAS
jgi:hypothetical protein